jgi:hypothetical protein
MKQMSFRTLAIATSAFACATLLSFSWSEQRGVSLSVGSAQARVGRPLTPVSVAGVARRQDRRAYRYNAAGIAGPEAANYFGLASAAGTPVVAGTAAAVAATQPWGGRLYVGTGALAANALVQSKPIPSISPRLTTRMALGMVLADGLSIRRATALSAIPAPRSKALMA